MLATSFPLDGIVMLLSRLPTSESWKILLWTVFIGSAVGTVNGRASEESTAYQKDEEIEILVGVEAVTTRPNEEILVNLSESAPPQTVDEPDSNGIALAAYGPTARHLSDPQLQFATAPESSNRIDRELRDKERSSSSGSAMEPELHHTTEEDLQHGRAITPRSPAGLDASLTPLVGFLGGISCCLVAFVLVPFVWTRCISGEHGVVFRVEVVDRASASRSGPSCRSTPDPGMNASGTPHGGDLSSAPLAPHHSTGFSERPSLRDVAGLRKEAAIFQNIYEQNLAFQRQILTSKGF